MIGSLTLLATDALSEGTLCSSESDGAKDEACLLFLVMFSKLPTVNEVRNEKSYFRVEITKISLLSLMVTK